MNATLQRFFPTQVPSAGGSEPLGKLLYYLWQTQESRFDGIYASWFNENHKARGVAGVLVASGLAPTLTRDFLPPPYSAPSNDPSYLHALALEFGNGLTKGAGIQIWKTYEYYEKAVTANVFLQPHELGHSLIFYKYAIESSGIVMCLIDQNGYTRVPLLDLDPPATGKRWYWSGHQIDIWFGSNWA